MLTAHCALVRRTDNSRSPGLRVPSAIRAATSAAILRYAKRSTDDATRDSAAEGNAVMAICAGQQLLSLCLYRYSNWGLVSPLSSGMPHLRNSSMHRIGLSTLFAAVLLGCAQASRQAPSALEQ